jgi:tRNA(Ile)-lysidine synthase
MVLDYLKTRRLPYAQDRTNENTRYRRNLVRHSVLPLLKKINPRILETIERTAAVLKQDDECLDDQAGRIFRRTARLEPDRVLLDIAKLIRYNKALVSRVVMQALKARSGRIEGIERKHIISVIGLIAKHRGAVAHLPTGMYARRDYGELIIGRRDVTRGFMARLPLGGECRLPDGHMVRARILSAGFRGRPTAGTEFFDRAAVHPPLIIRERRPGDRLATAQGRKKLKKFCTEYRIPFDRRPGLLVLADREGVLCLLGYARSRRALITAATARAVAVSYEKTDR